MKIVFFVPWIDKKKFSGGLYCILRHADELVCRGHEVFVVTYPKSSAPEWIDLKAKLIIPRMPSWPKKLPFHHALISMAGYFLNYISLSYGGF